MLKVLIVMFFAIMRFYVSSFLKSRQYIVYVLVMKCCHIDNLSGDVYKLMVVMRKFTVLREELKTKTR